MKYFKVNITNDDGGEYTYGMLTKKDEIELMKATIENGEEFGSSIEGENSKGEMIYMESHNYTELVHCFGPDISSTPNVTIVACADEYCQEEIEDEIEIYDFYCFTSLNPYPSDILDNYNDDALQWGTQKIEENITFEAYIKLNDNEEFNAKNLFLGGVDLSKTMSNSQILDTVLYIRKEDQIKIIEAIYDEKEDLDLIYEAINEYCENQDVFKKFICENGDVEGNGEYENNKAFVYTKAGKELYVGEAY